MDNKNEEFLKSMAEFGERQLEARLLNAHRIEQWWNGLSKEEQKDAFYAVVKRIHKAEMIDQGSYRYVLYDVFGFGPDSYGMGMDCGFLELHNAIDPEYYKAYEK